MKLVVRTVEGANLPGGRALVLCDEHGVMLPEQAAVTIEQEEHAAILVTVAFRVNGDTVVLDGSLIEDDD
ncbi:hypothetical protein [Sphingobium sp. CECT 9361]|uniref:hypothetical protein n=1 Tax=Sphingobium sp. CECT 9361 TaxID=2845384 RepID=UPI001E2B91AD|nr:hypothetical protein [Sphingobium sp. CECT 9361]CAH0355313.1 hypothetical protein SPH9361_03390 [Sphingobium sp. CECT 9361]